MTMKPKARKFRVRRNSETSTSQTSSSDGFGSDAFPGSAKAESDATSRESGIAEVRREGLTGRQLRMARRMAQKHGMTPGSDFEAVWMLRAKGIDPFDRANMLELVEPKRKPAPAANEPVQRQAKVPSKAQQLAKIEKTTVLKSASKLSDAELEKASQGKALLPQKVDDPQKNLPGEHRPETAHFSGEMQRIQKDIVRRRRRNLTFLFARLAVFVLLPTVLAFYYFAFIATPGYTTKSVFEVQQAEASSAQGGLLGGTSFANSQDSIMVQDFLTSREALALLNDDHGYREHFSGNNVDFLQRLPDDASNEDVFSYYQKNVQVSYDQTEGVIRMEVTALSPESSKLFSEALIGYAEERVDQVTERKRGDQMQGARESFDEAEGKMIAAQERVLELQEQLGVLDPASETSALMTQIGTFETQLAEKRLQLQQLLDNTQPNRARLAGVEGDIGRLENLIADLRLQMTEEGANQGSLASISAQLRMAEVDLETRTLIMQESLQQMEAARIEAMRQVRFLSLGVAPIPPDVPTSPKVFENTLITFFAFAAIYLLVSLTIAVLREQVSS